VEEEEEEEEEEERSQQHSTRKQQQGRRGGEQLSVSKRQKSEVKCREVSVCVWLGGVQGTGDQPTNT
jgi:hypothetical protein